MLDAAVASNLLARWDAQQQRYIAHREERFEIIVEAVRLQCGASPRVIDLCGGPGSLGQRLLRALPQATIWEVDADPLLQSIGRAASSGLHWIETDLRAPGWNGFIDGETVDAVVSTTALHWLLPHDLVRLYGELAATIRTGGIFLNGDHQTYPPTLPKLGRLGAALTESLLQRRARDAEDWATWWQAASAVPALKDAFLKRERIFADHHDDDRPTTIEFHLAALQDAGFAESGTLWQVATDWIVAAIR